MKALSWARFGAVLLVALLAIPALQWTVRAATPVTVSVNASDVPAEEDGGDSITFTFTRSGETLENARLVTFTVAGSADLGTDFTLVPECPESPCQIEIPAASATVDLLVLIVDDSEDEPDESIQISVVATPDYGRGPVADAETQILDDDLPTVTLGLQDGTAAEPSDTGAFTVARSPGELSEDLVVRYDVAGSARNGADYAPFSGLVTIPAGATEASLVVSPRDDSEDESDETVEVSIAADADYLADPSHRETVVLEDDDVPLVSIATADPSADESGLDAAAFTVSRTSGDTSTPLSVRLAASGTSTEGTDYDTLPTHAIIPVDATSVGVNVRVRQDLRDEPAETVVLSLVDDPEYDLGAPPTAVAVIADDDLPEVSVQATQPASEAGQTGQFTFTRTMHDGPAPLDATYALGGTTDASDYALTPACCRVQFGANVATVTVAVAALDDAFDESAETLVATVEPGAAYQAGPDGPATLTISDNDLPLVSVVAKITLAREGGADGAFEIRRLTGDTSQALTVAYTVAGTASSSDYAALGSSVTIPPGATAAPVPVHAQDDTLDERATETIVLTIPSAPSYTRGTSTATVSVVDDDLPQVAISAIDADALEGGSGGALRVARSNSDNSYPLQVRFGVGGSAGSSDRTVTGSPVTIGTGGTLASILVSAVDDEDDEPVESVTVTLTPDAAYDISGAPEATVALLDDDIPSVLLSATGPTAPESGATSGEFRFTRSPGALSDPLTLAYTVLGTSTASSGEYQALSGAITIGAGLRSANLSLTAIGDALDERDETVVLRLDPIADAYTVDAPGTATVTILDDDLPTVTIQAPTPTATEGGTAALVRVTRANTDASSALAVLLGASGTSAADDHSEVPASLEIPAGAMTADLSLTALDDTLDEPLETLVLTILADAAYARGTPQSVQVNLADADLPTVTVLAPTASATEGGTAASLRFERASLDVGQALRVRFSATGEAVDDVTLAAFLDIPAGESSATLAVPAINDAIDEPDETLTVTILDDAAYATGTPALAALTVVDNDLPQILLTGTDLAASETGPDAATFRFARTNSVHLVPLTLTFHLDGTATPGTDYEDPGTSITIPEGSNTVDLTIAPTDDDIDESLETLRATLDPDSGYALGASTTATASLADDDLPLVTVSVAGPASESGTPLFVTFHRSRSDHSSALPVLYTITGTASTSDLGAQPGATLAIGQSSKEIQIPTVDDRADEPTETLRVDLTPHLSYEVGDPDHAETTLVDNDELSITTVSPTNGPTTGATFVTIDGTGFAPDPSVDFGGAPGIVQTVNALATRITVQAPAHPAGVVDVSVLNPGGIAATAEDAFEFRLPPPTLTSLTPASGAVAGGTEVLLAGSAFQDDPLVRFGGTDAEVVESDATSIRVTAPAHAAGPVSVIVTNADGQTSAARTFTYLPPPDLASLAPLHGPTTGGTTVTILGTGFHPQIGVRFGTTPAASVSSTPTQITAVTPAHDVGRVFVTVENPDGTGTDSLDGFEFRLPAPVLAGLVPASGPIAGGTDVTLAGAHLVDGLTVAFGGASGLVQSVAANGESAVVRSPAHAAGAVGVLVTNPDGQTSASRTFTYLPPPRITSISPLQGPTSGGTTLTITGTAFHPQAVVRFGETVVSTTSITSAQITLVTPPHALGRVPVSVTNPDGIGADVLDGFEYVPPPPTLASLDPTSGSTDGGTPVDLAGADFQEGLSVTFGGFAATVIDTEGSLVRVESPPHAAGPAPVVVTNPDGRSSAARTFTYVEPPQGAGLSPASGPSAGGTTVTITGENFHHGSTVYFGPTIATHVVVTATEITATTPAHAAGRVDVRVVSPDGTEIVFPEAFEFLDPAPVLSSLSPAQGSSLGGNEILLGGTGFKGGLVVRLGGTPATILSQTETAIRVRAPPHAAGAVGVIVTNPDGQVSPALTYTYLAAPRADSIGPARGSPTGGTTVTIEGAFFHPSATVRFGETAATIVTIASNRVTATTPAHALGHVLVTITNPDGSGETLLDGFDYVEDAPALTAVTPTSGPVTGGTRVNLTGQRFQPHAAVLFGDVEGADPTTNAEGTQVAVTSPPHAAGRVPITLVNPDGQRVTLASAFEFVVVAPPTQPVPTPTPAPTTSAPAPTMSSAAPSPAPTSSASPPSEPSPTTSTSPVPTSIPDVPRTAESPSGTPPEFFAPAIRAESQEDQSIEVTWSDPPAPGGEIGGYLVWRAASPFALVGRVEDPSVHEFRDPDVRPGQPYRYTVSYFLANGIGLVDRLTDLAPGVPEAALWGTGPVAWAPDLSSSASTSGAGDYVSPLGPALGLLGLVAVSAIGAVAIVGRRARGPPLARASAPPPPPVAVRATTLARSAGDDTRRIVVRCASCDRTFPLPDTTIRPFFQDCPHCGAWGSVGLGSSVLEPAEPKKAVQGRRVVERRPG